LNTNPPKKTEIFFLLALKQSARQNRALKIEKDEPENESGDAGENLTEADFPALFEQLNKKEAANLRARLATYQKKDEAQKLMWRERIYSSIGADEKFIDENVHRSHIENALQKEIPAIREIIAAALSNTKNSAPRNQNRNILEKNIRRAFAAGFVSLGEIENASAFDRLSGTQLARLVRRAGVREVSIACLRIEAVESVAAFIRIFPAEDARMIAAQLGNVPDIADERIAFAENLVHTAFEIEPNPSAMLDWVGIWLAGVLLCRSSPARVRYTQQKLPLEFAPRLPEIIEKNCLETPFEMQKVIGGEIERLAETIAETAGAQ
jgi:hypothetical protein